MMPAMRTIGILVLVLVAGCASVKETPPSVARPLIVAPSVAGPTHGVVAAESPRSAAKAESTALAPPPVVPSLPVITGDKPIGIEPAVGVPTTRLPSNSKSQSVAKAAPVKAPTNVIPAPVVAEQPRKTEAPPTVAKTLEPPLDLAALKARLRETDAIGMFTKLSLKNQVDDLLDQFRAYYQGRIKTTLAELRRPYELLLMKVLAVLQDGDPALAHAINASREAIWGILADRDTFAKVAA